MFVEYITLVLLVTIPVGIALYAVMPQVYSIYTMGRAVVLFPFP